MDRNHGAISSSIGASLGVPVNENHRSLLLRIWSLLLLY